MNDYMYIIDNKMMFLSADEEISYKQAWKLVHIEVTEQTKSIARKETVKDSLSCEYKKIKSFTDLEDLITV
jgi:hypothetical protein